MPAKSAPSRRKKKNPAARPDKASPSTPPSTGSPSEAGTKSTLPPSLSAGSPSEAGMKTTSLSPHLTGHFSEAGSQNLNLAEEEARLNKLSLSELEAHSQAPRRRLHDVEMQSEPDVPLSDGTDDDLLSEGEREEKKKKAAAGDPTPLLPPAVKEGQGDGEGDLHMTSDNPQAPPVDENVEIADTDEAKATTDTKASEKPPVDPFQALIAEAVNTTSSADEVEEDIEFKNTQFSGRNMYDLLAEGARIPQVAPQASTKKLTKPPGVTNLDKIPDPHRSPKFFMNVTRYFRKTGEREMSQESIKAFNTGTHGDSNSHATFFIDGGKIATPALKITVTLSKDPAKKLEMGDPNAIHVTATFPCGDVTTARGTERAFLGNEFFRILPKEKVNIPLPEPLQQMFRLKSDKTPDQFRDRLFCMKWKTGGAVVLGNFSHPIVKSILASPNGAGYTQEAEQTLRTMCQLTTRGCDVHVLWAPKESRQIESVGLSLDCFKWSVNKGLFFFWPYADEDGNFTGDVEHITKVGQGFLDKNRVKNHTPGNQIVVNNFHNFDLEYPVPNLTSYLISVAVAEARELEQAKITKDGLKADPHRAWVVASSPLQLEEKFRPSDSDWYMVYVQISTADVDIKELIPKPAEIIQLQWLHSEQGIYEAGNLRWKGPVIELQNDREMGLCHFVMFAEAKKDSVRPKIYRNIQDALRGLPNGLQVSIEVECRVSLRRKEVFGLKKLFYPKHLALSLTLMGKQDEADKIALDPARPPFQVKNSNWPTRADAEATEHSQWLQWVNSTNESPAWRLNPSQLASIKDLAGPQRLSATQGPPGTGKSKTGAAAIAAAVKAGHKVLCVASSNAATDNIANAIRAAKPSDLSMKIVRAHVPAAEWHAATSDAPEAERRGQMSDRIKSLTATFEMATIVGTTDEDMRKLNQIAMQVHERHFVDFDLSMAQAVLLQAHQTKEKLSAIPAGELTETNLLGIRFSRQYLELRELFQGKALAGESAEAFHASYNFLSRMVLEQADVVVTTCLNATAEYLTSAFRPRLVVHDEAGQSPDFETILAVTAYPTTMNIVFLGDQDQLEPTVTSLGRNEFAKARRYPVMARLSKQINVHFLDTQYRMRPAISKYPNVTIYDGRIKDAPSTKIEGPISRAVRRYLHTKIFKGSRSFDKVREVLFVDLPNSRGWRSEKTHSKENHVEADFIADHTAGMLQDEDGKHIKADDISIIVIYKSQLALIRSKLIKRLSPEDYVKINITALEISTVYSFQGRQNKIIFLSWVVGGVDRKDPHVTAFFRDAHRLCVAISRAQHAFIMAGNFRGLLAALDPKNSSNNIRAHKAPPKLFHLLKMVEQEGDLFRYPESEYPDTAPQRLGDEILRRSQQQEHDMLTAQDAQSSQNRKRRLNQGSAANKRQRGGSGAGNWRGGRGGQGGSSAAA